MTVVENQTTRADFVARFGSVLAIVTAVTTLITFSIAVLTPPGAGPFCQGPCFEYPYHDIAARFPRDYFWMYPAMLVSLLYVMLMATIHHYADKEKKLFGQIGLSFALIAAMVLIANYFVQVSVVQPSLLNGETDGIALISQFNPHGVFIALEEMGYLIMAISFVSVVPVFSGKRIVLKAVRVTYLTGFVLAAVSLVFVSIQYGIMREYIYEVIIISIVWLELIISAILLSRVFLQWGKG